MATPTMIQHLSTSNTGSASGNAGMLPTQLDVYLPNPTLPGNCLVLGVTFVWVSGLTIGTPIDDGGNTWTTGPYVADTGNQIAIFYAMNIVAGTRHITIPITGYVSQIGNPGYASVKATEFSNIALTAAEDSTGAAQTNASGTTWSAGSFTTGTAGDMIWSCGWCDNGNNNTSWTAGTQGSGFTLLDADIVDIYATSFSQWQVQATAGAINAGVTLGAAAAGLMACIALKSASAGTSAPAGIRVLRMQHQSSYGTNTTVNFQFPSAGNLLVCTGSTPGTSVSAISDSVNTWSVAKTQTDTGVLNTAFTWYAPNATTASTLKGTLTYTGSVAETFFTFFDIIGAATSPLGATYANQGNATANGKVTTGSITPTNNYGLTYGQWAISQGTCFGVCGVNLLFNYPTYPQLNATTRGSNQPSPFAENNGMCHYYHQSTSPVTFTWATTADFNSGVGGWAFVATEFLAASPTATTYAGPLLPSSPLTLVGPIGIDGIYTWTVPANYASGSAAWDLQGSGGAGSYVTTNLRGGGGGGGGGCSGRTAPTIVAGNVYVFNIGGAGSDVAGTVYSGGTTEGVDDKSTPVLTIAHSGTSAASNALAGGAAGSSGTGDYTFAGGAGGAGVASEGGGGGGGGGGTTAAGTIGGTASGTSGGGGGAKGTGGSLAGAGGAGRSESAGNGPGTAGSNYGGGGGGGYRATASESGGQGGLGAVYITWTTVVGGTFYPWIFGDQNHEMIG